MTRDTLLRGLERGLLTVGLALGVWCAAVLVEARFHNAVTIGGPLTVTQTAVPALPGDADHATGDLRSAPANAAGSGRLSALGTCPVS